MRKPSKPRKPTKPSEPQTTILRKIMISLSDLDGVKLKNIAEKISEISNRGYNEPQVESWEEITLHFEYGYYEDPGHIEIEIPCRNLQYDNQMKRYARYLKTYTKNMEKYEKKMIEYNEKYAIWNAEQEPKRLKEMAKKKRSLEKQIENIQKEIENLTS